jgi:hypothetical protein
MVFFLVFNLKGWQDVLGSLRLMSVPPRDSGWAIGQSFLPQITDMLMFLAMQPTRDRVVVLLQSLHPAKQVRTRWP